MRTLPGRRTRMLGVMAALLAAACGSGDDTGPTTRLAVAKALTKSGDLQTGIVGEPLGDELRVVVTREGVPEPDVTVTWSTADGTLAPTSDETDAEGVSASSWTLGETPGSMTATASVTNASGSPVSFTATGISGGGGGVNTVQVLSEGGTRFSPKNITVQVGSTVTWVWGPNATGHNVVPDAGNTPASSGPLANAPHSYPFIFNTPGTYAYHCAAHGNVGGVGMSGTVTVVTELP